MTEVSAGGTSETGHFKRSPCYENGWILFDVCSDQWAEWQRAV